MKIFIIISILFMAGYAGLYYVAGRALRENIGPGFVISFLVPMAVGMFVPSSPLFLATVFICFIATVKGPLDAVCRYVLLTALLPNAGVYVTMGGAWLFYLGSPSVLAVATLAVGVFRRGPGARPPRGATPEDLLVLIFFAITWIGGTRFESATIFMREGTHSVLLLLAPYYALRLNVRSQDDLRRVIACIAAGATILAVLAMYEVWNHWTVYGSIDSNLANGHQVRSKNVMVRGGLLRPTTSMSGPLMLSCYLAFASLAMAISRSWFRSTFGWVGCLGLVLAGCLAGQSRGNAAGILLGIVLLLALRRKWGAAGAVAGAGAAAAAVVVAVSTFSRGTAAIFNLSAQYSHGTSVYYDYRGLLLHRGLEEGMRHLWTGISLKDNIEHLSDITQGQGIVDLVNTYLTVFLVSGLVGFIPVVALLALIVWRLFRNARNLTPEVLTLRAFLLATMVMILAQLAFMSMIDRLPFMLMFVLAGARLFMLTTRSGALATPDAAGPVARTRLVEGANDLPAGPGAGQPGWGVPVGAH